MSAPPPPPVSATPAAGAGAGADSDAKADFLGRVRTASSGRKRLDTCLTPSCLPSGAKAQSERTVLVLVGLPARGKSYIAHKLVRYLNWNGIRTRIFNAGAMRRKLLGPCSDSAFFNPSNPDAAAAREEIAVATLKQLLQWLDTGGGHVGVFDATNTTRSRRRCVIERVKAAMNCQVVFIESICTDPVILEQNYKVKLTNADYKDKSPEEASADFLRRVKQYEAVYETITDEDLSYIQLINVGRRLIINRCSGAVMSEVTSCLSNLHVTKRSIFLCRHGESEDNARGLLGGDSSLTPAGREFATALADFMRAQKLPELHVWTSTLQRTQQTDSTPLLNELDGGCTEGLTYAQVEERFPALFEARKQDKLHFRYPGGGESYMDVVERLKPLILELERLQVPVLIVGHQGIARCILSYWTDVSLERMPHLEVPLHCVFKLTPTMYGYTMERHKATPDGSGKLVWSEVVEEGPTKS